jgi:hypothetical protein
MSNLEERFKLNCAELSVLDPAEENAEYKEFALRDNIDFILDKAVRIGEIICKPLEPKIYKMSFPGRANGKIRNI